MELFLIGGFCICLLFCIGEVYHEHDWPRDTFPYLAASALALAIWTFAVS